MSGGWGHCGITSSSIPQNSSSCKHYIEEKDVSNSIWHNYVLWALRTGEPIQTSSFFTNRRKLTHISEVLKVLHWYWGWHQLAQTKIFNWSCDPVSTLPSPFHISMVQHYQHECGLGRAQVSGRLSTFPCGQQWINITLGGGSPTEHIHTDNHHTRRKGLFAAYNNFSPHFSRMWTSDRSRGEGRGGWGNAATPLSCKIQQTWQ